MRQLLILSVCVLLCCGVSDTPRSKRRAASPAAREEAPLTWENLPSEVSDLRKMAVTVQNRSSHPVYLSRVWPFGFPQLMRFDEDRKLWEEGNIPIGCGTVRDPNKPIMIPPGARIRLGIIWSSSIDDRSIPPMFVPEETPTATQPLAGQYRLRLRYALEPWTASAQPKQIRTVESPTFRVTLSGGGSWKHT